PGDYVQVSGARANHFRTQEGGIGNSRHPDIWLGKLQREIELRRKNADERYRASIDAHHASERPRLGAEMAVPETVRNYGHVSSTLGFFFGKKIAAATRRNPQHPEEVLRDAIGAYGLGFALGNQAHGGGIKSAGAFESVALLANLREFCERHVDAGGACRAIQRGNIQEPRGIFIRERLEE